MIKQSSSQSTFSFFNKNHYGRHPTFIFVSCWAGSNHSNAFHLGVCGMTSDEAISFIKEHGVVLASAKGPVPRLTEAILNGPIKGSWWAHPKSHQIFAVLQAVTDSDEVLVCRLVNGKVTFIHRRLWPAFVRVAKRFPSDRIAQVHEEHTASGRHV